MSLKIKNMKMPDNCIECLFGKSDICPEVKGYWFTPEMLYQLNQGRMSSCPLSDVVDDEEK